MGALFNEGPRTRFVRGLAVTGEVRALGKNKGVRAVRTVILTNMVPPYRVPLFNAIAEQPGMTTTVVSLTVLERNRQWVQVGAADFEHVVLSGIQRFSRRLDWALHFNNGVWRCLNRLDPDVVVCSGYDQPAYWAAFFWTRWRNRKFVLWSGSTLLSSKNTENLVAKVKSWLICRAEAYVAYGTEAARYLEYLGAVPSRVYTGCNTVDVREISRMVPLLRHQQAIVARRKEMPGFLLLYSGQLIERKGVRDLIRLMERLRAEDIGLMIVGGGPLEDELRTYAREQGLANVFFAGFKEGEELYACYAMVDALVLPSREEVWGLVINEALAAELPVLCSNRAGCVSDLVIEGVTGYTFAPEDVDSLEKKVRFLAANPQVARQLGTRGADLVSRKNVTYYASAFIAAIDDVTNGALTYADNT